MALLNKLIARTTTSILTFGDVVDWGGEFLPAYLSLCTAPIPPQFTNITDANAAGYAPDDLFEVNTLIAGLVASQVYYIYTVGRGAGYPIESGPIVFIMPSTIPSSSAGAFINCEPGIKNILNYTYAGADAEGYLFDNDSINAKQFSLVSGQVVDMGMTTTSDLLKQERKELLIVINGATVASVIAVASSWLRPTSFYYNRGKSYNHVDANNVMVFYRTDQTGADTIKDKYKTVRNIPNANIVALSGLSTPATSGAETTASAIVLLQKVIAGIASSPNIIKAFVMIGDFSETISDKAHVDSRVPATVMTCLVHPVAALAELQKATSVPFPNPLPLSGSWGPATVGPARAINPALANYSDIDFWQNPPVVAGDTYAVCNIPIGPNLTGYLDGVTVALARIDEIVAAEKRGYSDWGTCLLAAGDAQVSSPFVAEACMHYNTATPPNIYWYNLVTPSYDFVSYPTGVATARDPSGWARWQPGETGFPVGTAKPNDVGLRSAGNLNYYEGTHTQIEQPGDYNYRKGASIVVCAQSYGAYPGSGANFVDNYSATPTFAILAAAAVYGGGAGTYAALSALGTNGSNAEYVTIYRNTATTNDGHTVEQSPTTIIFKLNGVEQGGVGNGRVTLTGKTVQQVIDAIITKANAINLADSSAQWFISSAGNRRMSRALAAWRSGAAMAFGVTAEPNATGHAKTIGLFSAMFTGSNVAEWLLRAHAGWRTGGNQPQSWAVYADPLMNIFRQARCPGACVTSL